MWRGIKTFCKSDISLNSASRARARGKTRQRSVTVKARFSIMAIIVGGRFRRRQCLSCRHSHSPAYTWKLHKCNALVSRLESFLRAYIRPELLSRIDPSSGSVPGGDSENSSLTPVGERVLETRLKLDSVDFAKSSGNVSIWSRDRNTARAEPHFWISSPREKLIRSYRMVRVRGFGINWMYISRWRD